MQPPVLFSKDPAGRYPLARFHPSDRGGPALIPARTHMSFSAALSFQPMLASPPLISCLPAACTPSAPRIPLGQDSAPRALSSLEDWTVVAKQSIQGTTVANCLTQANSWYFSVCLDYQWGKQ